MIFGPILKISLEMLMSIIDRNISGRLLIQ